MIITDGKWLWLGFPQMWTFSACLMWCLLFRGFCVKQHCTLFRNLFIALSNRKKRETIWLKIHTFFCHAPLSLKGIYLCPFENNLFVSLYVFWSLFPTRVFVCVYSLGLFFQLVWLCAFWHPYGCVFWSQSMWLCAFWLAMQKPLCLAWDTMDSGGVHHFKSKMHS